MEKYCVFCGQKPKNKNKEHIIPQWLIEYTGDPKRNINMGLKMDGKNGLKLREFAFSQFTMPACEKCNSEFGILENEVKPIIINIIEKNELQYSNISILLDWLDKVRVGLWSAFMILNNNYFDLVPHLTINNRVGKSDRFLYIYKTRELQKGINFIGSDSLVFQLLPSCFTLRINNFYFFNASKDFLFSRRLGFPYVTSRQYYCDNSDKQIVTIAKGRGEMKLPLIRGNNFIEGTEIFQPMFAYAKENTVYSELYNDDNIRKRCLNYEKGIGKPVVLCGKTRIIDKDIFEFKKIEFSTNKEDPVLFHSCLSKQTYEYQIKLLEQSECSYLNISEEIEKVWKDKTEAAIFYNKGILEILQKEISQYFVKPGHKFKN
ncbi:hypothetical protein [Lacrimispora sp.]|uniref:hypothetical protein n=1 Tax=Lacrimispora sp. TaxID=2719234 RepID=UPI00289FA662|nr:hypothetical protein [Lacrimispora sp.]